MSIHSRDVLTDNSYRENESSLKILYAAPLPLEELRKIGTGEKELKGNHEHFLFPLFSNMREKGNDIILVTSSREIREEEVYRQKRLTIHIVPLWSHGRLSALDTFRTDVGRIREVINKIPADIYHAQWSYEEAMACLDSHPEKTVITMHDWPDAVCPAIGNYYWKKRNILGNNVIARGRKFIAVSPYIEEKLRRENKNADIEVIPNWFCEDELAAFEAVSSAHKEIRILCVNNGFSGIKNTTVAMRAFQEVKKEMPACRMDMYGDDYEAGGRAEQWAKKNLGDTSGLTFHGRADRYTLAEAFREADILLHTSKEESFGLIYLEAMASGTAIIAGETTGATPWVLGDELKEGLTDITDVVEVKKKLKDFILSDRAQLTEAGMKRLKEYFLDSGIYSRIEKYYMGLQDGR